MRLRTYKFLVTPVLQQIDENGAVVGEQPGGQDTVYGVEALARYADGFEVLVVQGNEQIAAAEAALTDEG